MIKIIPTQFHIAEFKCECSTCFGKISGNIRRDQIYLKSKIRIIICIGEEGEEIFVKTKSTKSYILSNKTTLEFG